MRVELEPVRRRLARSASRMNRSLHTQASSTGVRLGIVAARLDGKCRGFARDLAAWTGRSVRVLQAPAGVRARMNRISAAEGGRDWQRPLQSIRTAARRLSAAVIWLAADWKQGSRDGLDQISERLNFGFARKLPVLRQTEAAECGLVCLAMVASYFGLRTDPGAIRSRHATSNRGL